MVHKLLLSLLFFVSIITAMAQETIYDERQVPAYSLPPLLQLEDGTPVENSDQWRTQRRPELVKLLATYEYGIVPETIEDISFQLKNEDKNALNGNATRKEIVCTLRHKEHKATFTILLFLPNQQQPAPVFVGLNFSGNHTVHPDPAISITESWVSNSEELKVDNNKATDASRGLRANRWPIERIIARGYGLATIYCGDLAPDNEKALEEGITRFFIKKGATRPDSSEWGAVAAWAYGLSRAMDYLQQDAQVDKTKVAVIGHSRLGKAALWAGATDERFSLVISNESGCGGAALSKRQYGETVKAINTTFPHWFCDNFKTFNGNEDKMPFDQHMLLALVAPRPLYVASALEDQWADPRGEFLAAKETNAVYALFEKPGLEASEMPPTNQPSMTGTVAYHIRTGKHDITTYDWEMFMNFAAMQWGR